MNTAEIFTNILIDHFFCVLIITVLVILLLAVLFKKKPSPAAATASKIPIDLSALDDIFRTMGSGSNLDCWPLSENEIKQVRKYLSGGIPLPPSFLDWHPPLKIAYLDIKGINTIRDIIPFRINGYIEQNKEKKLKEYDFHIEAFCLLRKEERSFHTNGISAAWLKGKEINLGDYLAEMYYKKIKY